MSKDLSLDLTEKERTFLILITALEELYGLLCPGRIRIAEKYAHPTNIDTYGLFYTNLIDLLSPIDESFLKGDLLENIKFIFSNCSYFKNGKKTIESINTFKTWLNERKTYKFYLAEVSKEEKLNFSRQEMIKFLGNKNKHSNLRILITIKRICKNNPHISFREFLFSIPSIKERFHEDILEYYFSFIVQQLVHIYNSLLSDLKDSFKLWYERKGLQIHLIETQIPKLIENEEVLLKELIAFTSYFKKLPHMNVYRELKQDPMDV